MYYLWIKMLYVWSYHRFNNLAELLNGDLATKIGWGIFCKDLTDREYNYSLSSKVNRKCVYEGKCQSKCRIYKVKCSICDAIYRGNTQKTFKKRMDCNFSNLLRLLNNGQKSDSISAHFEQHFNGTTSRIYIRKYMIFKVVKQLNPIGAMKIFTKPNSNLCVEERLTILKKLREKRVTIMNNNLEMCGACRHKTTFRRFCLSTEDPVFNRWKGWAVKGFSNLRSWTRQRSFLILKTFLKINQLWKNKLNHTLC